MFPYEKATNDILYDLTLYDANKNCLCLYTQIIATHSLTWRIIFG